MKDFFLNYPTNKLCHDKIHFILDNDNALNYHNKLEEYSKTPLIQLNGLAKRIGVNKIFIKDESKRFGLNAYKVLGASYAIYKILSMNPKVSTFCTATDGNHGMAVAWSCNMNNKESVIYVPKDTSDQRIQSLSAIASRVYKTDLNYERTCQLAKTTSRKMNWQLVQDTSWKGYEEIPAYIMSGYLTQFKELENEINSIKKPKADIIFFQTGVGSWAASGIWYYLNKYGTKKPKIILVEPNECSGVFESFINGKRISPKGNFKTIMAGLNCGIPSKIAWEIIKNGCDACLKISDKYAKEAMRSLFYNHNKDLRVISGESGAAGLAGLMKCIKDESLDNLRNHIGLSSGSKILVFNTEGDTDKESFKSIIKN